jgi:hypothetical protein
VGLGLQPARLSAQHCSRIRLCPPDFLTQVRFPTLSIVKCLSCRQPKFPPIVHVWVASSAVRCERSLNADSLVNARACACFCARTARASLMYACHEYLSHLGLDDCIPRLSLAWPCIRAPRKLEAGFNGQPLPCVQLLMRHLGAPDVFLERSALQLLIGHKTMHRCTAMPTSCEVEV